MWHSDIDSASVKWHDSYKEVNTQAREIITEKSDICIIILLHKASICPSRPPIGELFDHGLDSWAAILLPVCLASGFGRWHISASDDFWACVSVLGAFYVSHWEKYVTGIMYLPWLYDIMQLVGSEKACEKLFCVHIEP